MKTLVTGATGFIGARLIEELLQRGERVHVLCRPSSDAAGLTDERITVFRGDLRSTDDIKAAMTGCDRVYHLAAFAKNWARDEEAARRENLVAVKAMLDAARESGIRRLVYTSTILTYGPSAGAAVSEETERRVPPLTIYEQMKIDADAMVDEAVTEGLDVVVVHPTRVFGPGKLTQANSTTILIKQYVKGTWRTIPGSGRAIGNYVYVRDVVRGCIAAMERGSAGKHYILSGANLTFSELFNLLAETSGKRRTLLPIPMTAAKFFSYVELGLARTGLHEPAITPGWVDIFYGDWICTSALAQKEIGYEPTPIEQALTETITWVRGNGTAKEVSS